MSSILAAEFTLAAAAESALATVILFESPRSLEIHRGTGVYTDVDADRLQVMGNPAPAGFGAVEPASGVPHRITIVSNHLPPELVAAFPELRKRFHLDIIGSESELGAVPRRVTPETLAATDAVISIGKTVQYAIVSGVPVYCYDHFGGPGWITLSNIDDARWENFSGRRGGSKNTATIVAEISEGFDAAIAAAASLRREWSRAYLLPHRVEDLIEYAEGRRKPARKLSSFDIQAHENVQAALGTYVREWVRAVALSNELTLANLETVRVVDSLRSELHSTRYELSELYSSRSYRYVKWLRTSWMSRALRKVGAVFSAR